MTSLDMRIIATINMITVKLHPINSTLTNHSLPTSYPLEIEENTMQRELVEQRQNIDTRMA
jgi:hypothetical protein